jgi:hypothetical protein
MGETYGWRARITLVCKDTHTFNQRARSLVLLCFFTGTMHWLLHVAC